MSVLRRYSLTIALLVALITGITSFMPQVARGMYGTDDNLIFYLCGLNLFNSEKIRALNDEAFDFFERNNAPPHALYRLDMHRKILNEFLLPGMVYYGVSRTFKPLFEPAPQLYPLYMAQANFFGFLFAFLASIGTLIWIFARLKQPLLGWALALTVLWIGLSELLPLRSHPIATILMWPNVPDMLKQLYEMTFKPGPQFSALSFPPRGHFALLLTGVFALRWSGRHLWGYVMVVLLSLVHLDTAAMALVMLVSIDLVLRPALFRQISLLIVVAVGLAAFAWRSSLIEIIVGWQAALALAVIAFLGALIVWAFTSGRFADRLSAPQRALLGLRNWLLRPGEIAAELIVIAAGWLSTLIVAYVLVRNQAVSWEHAFYFWGQVHGRGLMMVLPTLIFGLFTILLGALANRMAWLKRSDFAVLLPLALLAFAPVLVDAIGAVQARNILVETASGYMEADDNVNKKTFGQARDPSVGEVEKLEKTLYYAIAKSVDLGGNAIRWITN